MFDAMKVLDQFLGAGTAAKVNEMTSGKFGEVVTKTEQTIGSIASESVGGLSDLAHKAREYLPGANDPNAPDIGAMAHRAKDFVEQNASAIGMGAVAGTLATVLLGTQTGRNVAGTAAKLGGLALIGGLAYRAYQNWQAGTPATTEHAQSQGQVTPPPSDSTFSGPHAGDAHDRALFTLRAMIAAAKADGEIDADERARIMGRAGALGVDPAAHAFIEGEMARPLDIDALVAEATTPEQKVELYAASAVAVDPSHPANAAYLDTLAEKLGLDAELRKHVDAQAEAARRS